MFFVCGWVGRSWWGLSLFERIAVVLVPGLLSDSRSGGSCQQDFPVGRIFSSGHFSYRWEIFPIGGKFFLSVGNFSHRWEIFPIGGYRWDIFPIGGTFFLPVGHFSYPRDIFPIGGTFFLSARGTFFLSVGHFSRLRRGFQRRMGTEFHRTAGGEDDWMCSA